MGCKCAKTVTVERDIELAPLLDASSDEAEPKGTAEVPAEELGWYERGESAFQLGKSAWQRFKGSPLGIFLLERWLPLQDTALDLLITFGKAGWPLCSDDGLLGIRHVFFIMSSLFCLFSRRKIVKSCCKAETTGNIFVQRMTDFSPSDTKLRLFWGQDIWWARISIALIGGTFVVWFLLISPIVFKKLKKHLGQTAAWVVMPLWTLLGLPSLAVADMIFLLVWPMSSPQQGWIANIMRLRVVTETLLESPGQALFQGRIFYVKLTTGRMELEASKVRTLAVSIGTSLFCLALTVKDIHDLAKTQDMGFFACLLDSLLVGLEWRAPLLHMLKSKQTVDFTNEGAFFANLLCDSCSNPVLLIFNKHGPPPY